jgi:hypothetical protein
MQNIASGNIWPHLSTLVSSFPFATVRTHSLASAFLFIAQIEKCIFPEPQALAKQSACFSLNLALLRQYSALLVIKAGNYNARFNVILSSAF